MVGVAAERGAVGLEFGVVLPADLEVRVDDEDRLAPGGAEPLAAARLAGLDEHGVALRRTRHGEGTTRLEVLALVVEALDLRGVGEAAAFLVDDQRVVRPGVPVAEDDLDELVGAIVPEVVVDRAVAAHVGGFDVIERRDDVPGAAALGHQVEGLEGAGDVEGLVVGRRHRRAEAQPLRRHRHRHQAGHRVHLDAANAVLDRIAVVAAVVLGHAEAVIEERHLELALFQHPGDVGVELRRREVRS